MAKGIMIEPRFCWNVEFNVGPGMPNKTEDVQLVQFGFACKALNPRGSSSAEEKAIYGAVVPGAAYTGAPNDPLTRAIKYHQKMRPGSTQDGIVSTIKGNTGGYTSSTPYTMVILNNNMNDILQKDWPRLDRHSMCPPALRDAVRRVMPGA